MDFLCVQFHFTINHQKNFFNSPNKKIFADDVCKKNLANAVYKEFFADDVYIYIAAGW